MRTRYPRGQFCSTFRRRPPHICVLDDDLPDCHFREQMLGSAASWTLTEPVLNQKLTRQVTDITPIHRSHLNPWSLPEQNSCHQTKWSNLVRNSSSIGFTERLTESPTQIVRALGRKTRSLVGVAHPVDLNLIRAVADNGCMGIPQDLVDYVMDILRDDSEALKACSLTCRSTFASTRRLIHETL